MSELVGRGRRGRVKFVCRNPSRTQQHYKDVCDVNKIMARFKKTVGVDYLSKFSGYCQGTFGDFSNVSDYRSALDQVMQVEDVFMDLPPEVRKKFSNDPALFLDAFNRKDISSIDDLVEFGLVKKPAEVSASADAQAVAPEGETA